MIYTYIRVSTDKQDQENQKYEIEQFAHANNLHIDKWIEETISSKKPLEERKLGKLIKKLKAEGRHIGRTKGTKNKTNTLTGKEELIEKLLAQNIKKTKIAEMLKVYY